MHEKDTWKRGTKTASFYQQDLDESAKPDTRTRIIHPADMPWEQSPQGLLKHLSNPGMANINSGQMDLYIQEIPPASASGKHRHMAEEVIYILDGKGYTLQWDVDAELKEKYEWRVAAEPKRCEWEEGDLVLIPVNTVHQHFNADAAKPARYVSASNSIYRWLGFLDLEQIEPAPKA
jgi:quercetin dioxygenase-like cupin family protein